MPPPPLYYRLRIRTADDTADALVVTSVPNGINPYISEEGIPEGDGPTLAPVTGEVATGAMSVGVIDAVDTFELDALLVTDEIQDYPNQAAAEANGWVFENDSEPPGGGFTFDSGDPVGPFSTSLILFTQNEGGSQQGFVRCSKIFAVTPGQAYRVKLEAGQTPGNAWYSTVDLDAISGANSAHTDINGTEPDQQLSLIVVAETASLLVVAQARSASDYAATQPWRLAHLTIEGGAGGLATGGVVTARLADTQGRQQLLSRRAFLEETEDPLAASEDPDEQAAVVWKVLIAGYVTLCELTTAMRYTIGIGESRRVEESVRVFEVAEPGFDRMSCLVGGPVIGDFGPYTDRGLPRFTVTDVTGAYVTLEWTGGELFGPFNEMGPPCRTNVRDYINTLAAPYLGYFGQTVNGLAIGGAPYNLVARLFDIETGPGTTVGLDGYDFTPVGILIFGTLFTTAALLNSKTAVTLWWPSGNPGGLPNPPAEGARFKMAVFPTAISERNPLHWRGHPVDLVTGLCALRNQAYDAASATSVRAELGDSLEIELRITASMSFKDACQKLAYGPFGFSARINDAGALEFFATRHRPSDAPATTITLDDLVDPAPAVWRTEEGSAVNKVTLRLKNFTARTDLPAHSDDGFGSASPSSDPIDYVGISDVPLEAVPSPSDFEVYGDRSVTYEIPGRLISTNATDFLAALASELFEERGRGAIISQLAVTRGGPDPRIGDETILDLPHLPTADPTQSPVSQRGTTPRIAMVIRRTPTPAGPLLTVVDRGIAAQIGLVPEFTIAPSDDEPRKIATVEITNGPALAAAGATVRIEWAVTGAEPVAGQLLRTLNPVIDALTFDLPPVDAGAVVWVRMRTEQAGLRPGNWSAFADADLDDLDAPTAFSGTLSGGFIDLIWTLGANAADIPIEILLREDSVADFDSVVVLPIGSTQYRLQLPVSETDYVIGVRHREAAPFAGVSPTTTLDETSEPTIELTPPIDPAVFADGFGTFGLEVTATVLPSGTEFWVAIETAIGSDTPDTSAAVQLLPSVAGGRTRFTNPSIAANDGKRRYLKARHVVGEATSDFCAELGVFPWVLLPPGDPVPDPDPPAALASTVFEIVGHRTGPIPWMFSTFSLAREVLADDFAVEDKFDLSGVVSVRVVESIRRSAAVDGARIGWEYSADDGVTWAPLAADAEGPWVAADAATVALMDGVKAGDWFLVADAARTDVRLRPVMFGGDDTGAWIPSGVVLQGRAQAENLPPDPEPEPPSEIPVTGGQYVEQTGGVGVTVPVGFFQTFEVDAIPDEDGEVTIRVGFFHTQAGGSYTRVGYFDNLRIVDADDVELWADGMEYADIAAMLAAGWTITDAMGAVSTTSISSTQKTEGAVSFKIAVTGAPPANSDCYATRVVDALPAGAPVTFSADVYENEEAEGSTGIACGIEIDSAGAATGGGGDGTDPVPDPNPAGGTRPFGAFALPTTGGGLWNCTVKAPSTPNECVSTINSARANGMQLILSLAGTKARWTNGDGTFNKAMYKARLDAMKADDGADAAITNGLADGTIFGGHIFDEPYARNVYGGQQISAADVEWACAYTKSLWAITAIVAMHVDSYPNDIPSCDVYWSQYSMPKGDVTAYRNSQLALAATYGKQVIMGINVTHFMQPGTGAAITADQLRHYGGILASTSVAVALFMWRFEADWYAGSGIAAAVAYVQGIWESFD
jgi:type 1 fimbria pilin